jgi:hypothetical protein
MPAVILNPNRGAMGAARFVALFAVAVACLFAAASPASAAGKTQPSSASGQMQRFDPLVREGRCLRGVERLSALTTPSPPRSSRASVSPTGWS